MITEAEIYARKNERITCENGHLIGILNRNITIYETFAAESVDWAVAGKYNSGARIQPCPICDANWNRGRTMGSFHAPIHFEGGWR